jgi:hypothetical protein
MAAGAVRCEARAASCRCCRFAPPCPAKQLLLWTATLATAIGFVLRAIVVPMPSFLDLAASRRVDPLTARHSRRIQRIVCAVSDDVGAMQALITQPVLKRGDTRSSKLRQGSPSACAARSCPN